MPRYAKLKNFARWNARLPSTLRCWRTYPMQCGALLKDLVNVSSCIRRVQAVGGRYAHVSTGHVLCHVGLSFGPSGDVQLCARRLHLCVSFPWSLHLRPNVCSECLSVKLPACADDCNDNEQLSPKLPAHALRFTP